MRIARDLRYLHEEADMVALHDESEVLSLFLIVTICVLCIAVGFTGPPADLIVSLSNAGAIIYRRLPVRGA